MRGDRHRHREHGSHPLGANSRTPIAIAPSDRTNGDRGGQVAASARLLGLGRLVGVPVVGVCHGSQLLLGPLDLEQLAFFVLDEFVDLARRTGVWSCRGPSRACLTSSSPASPSFLMRCSSSIALRRMLRTETLASSPLDLACLTRSRRRSSVSCGMATRMTLPSLVGLTPRSELRMAFSILPQLALLVGLDHHEPRLGHVDARQLRDRGHRAVVVDVDPRRTCPGWRGRCGSTPGHRGPQPRPSPSSLRHRRGLRRSRRLLRSAPRVPLRW